MARLEKNGYQIQRDITKGPQIDRARAMLKSAITKELGITPKEKRFDTLYRKTRSFFHILTNGVAWTHLPNVYRDLSAVVKNKVPAESMPRTSTLHLYVENNPEREAFQHGLKLRRLEFLIPLAEEYIKKTKSAYNDSSDFSQPVY